MENNKSKKGLIIGGIVVAVILVVAIAVAIGYVVIQNGQNNPLASAMGGEDNMNAENTDANNSNNSQENDTNTAKENIVSNSVNNNSTNMQSSDTNSENNTTGQNPIATIEIANYGTVKVELYPNMAPNTVKNFITLAKNGFYDGLTFHRVVEDFVIQGGDPKGNGTGGATLSSVDTSIKKGSAEDKEYCIPGEFAINGYTKNTLSHKEGVISMARSDYSSMGLGDEIAKKGYDSASSQFFIMTDDNTYLNGQYAAFGKVISGMEVVDKIDEIEVDENDKPLNPPVITKITVETYGVDYGKPETLEDFDINAYISQIYGITNAN